MTVKNGTYPKRDWEKQGGLTGWIYGEGCLALLLTCLSTFPNILHHKLTLWSFCQPAFALWFDHWHSENLGVKGWVCCKQRLIMFQWKTHTKQDFLMLLNPVFTPNFITHLSAKAGKYAQLKGKRWFVTLRKSLNLNLGTQLTINGWRSDYNKNNKHFFSHCQLLKPLWASLMMIPQIFIFPLLCILGQKISSQVVRCFFKVNIARLLIQTVLYSQIHCPDSGWQNFLAWCSLFQIRLWSLPVLTMYKNLGFSCCPQSQRKLVCWTLPFPLTHDKFLHRPIF